MIQLKRIYDSPDKADGFRMLVDRLWPRGISKEQAAIDLWLKEVAPSAKLRTWFGHKPERFEDFSRRYFDELTHNSAAERVELLVRKHPRVTLLYASKEPLVNHAVVLQKFIEKRL